MGSCALPCRGQLCLMLLLLPQDGAATAAPCSALRLHRLSVRRGFGCWKGPCLSLGQPRPLALPSLMLLACGTEKAISPPPGNHVPGSAGVRGLRSSECSPSTAGLQPQDVCWASSPRLEPPPMQDLLRLSLCSQPRSKDGEMAPELRFPASCLISCCSMRLTHEDMLLLLLPLTG